MKKAKKVLALALALAMVVGMFSGVSALTVNDYGDVDEISPQYKVAVGVLTGMGILEGQGDGFESEAGKFYPQSTVTRAEMTKIIYVMTLGDGYIDSDTTGEIFDDVADDDWYAVYVEWANSKGYVVGDGDGNFRPDDPIIFAEVGAILLRVLGYDAAEEYQHDDYMDTVQEDGTELGLLDVVSDESFDIMADCPREAAAQMAYNTLGIARVEYDETAKEYAASEKATYGEEVYDYLIWDEDGEAAQPVDESAKVMGLMGHDGVTGEVTIGEDSYSYAPSTREVGRIVDIYASQGGVVYYLDIASTDVTVEAGTEGDDLAEALEVELEDYDEVDQFENFVYDEENAADLTDLSDALLEQEATYVQYEDDIVSVIFVNKFVYNMSVTAAEDEDEAPVEGEDDEEDEDEAEDEAEDEDDEDDTVIDAEIVINGATVDADKIVNDSTIDLTEDGEYYVNVQILGGEYTISDLEVVDGVVSSYRTDIIVVGDNTLKLSIDPETPDTNNLSDITADESYYTAEFAEMAKNGPRDLTNAYGFVLSGVTGNVIAVEADGEVATVEGYAYVSAVDEESATLILPGQSGSSTVETAADYSENDLVGKVVEYTAEDGVYTIDKTHAFIEATAADETDFSAAEQTIGGQEITVDETTSQFVYISETDEGLLVVPENGFHTGALAEGDEYVLIATDGVIDVLFILTAAE